jgi:hypothetical protein
MVVLVGFLAFICLPLILTVAGTRPGSYDNRAPTDAPALGGDNLLDVATYQQLDRYLQDRFAFRGLAVRISAKLNDQIWRGDTDQVRRGRGEWLYYKPSLDQLCTEPMTPAEGLDVIGRFARTVEAGGARFRYALAPEKTSVYPEHLTDKSRTDNECAVEARDEIRRGLEAQSWYVDLYRPIEALKTASAEPIYHPRDTHWTGKGSGVLLEGVVESLQPGLWRPDEFVDTGLEPFEPDLTRLLGLGQNIQTPLYEVRRDGVTTVEGPEEAVDGSFPTRRFTSTSTAAPLIEGRTVMIYDSFTLGSLTNLAPYFADITFVHWNALGVADLGPLLGDADTVVAEGAEREFTWRMREKLAATGLADGRPE